MVSLWEVDYKDKAWRRSDLDSDPDMAKGAMHSWISH